MCAHNETPMNPPNGAGLNCSAQHKRRTPPSLQAVLLLGKPQMTGSEARTNRSALKRPAAMFQAGVTGVSHATLRATASQIRVTLPSDLSFMHIKNAILTKIQPLALSHARPPARHESRCLWGQTERSNSGAC